MEPCTPYQTPTICGNWLTAVGNLLLARVKLYEQH